MTLVFSVSNYHPVKQKINVKKVIIKPRPTKKMYMISKMGLITQKSCGCGK